VRRVGLLALLALVPAAGAEAATVPSPVLEATRDEPVGWVASGVDWFVVSLRGKGTGACGYSGKTWRIALVETAELPVRTVTARRLGTAECGNRLAWVRAGRFSDGRHREVAFMLWATPALGATAYVYRAGDRSLRLLATFGGDRVLLGPWPGARCARRC
jgi:hypothetical protein